MTGCGRDAWIQGYQELHNLEFIANEAWHNKCALLADLAATHTPCLLCPDFILYFSPRLRDKTLGWEAWIPCLISYNYNFKQFVSYFYRLISDTVLANLIKKFLGTIVRWVKLNVDGGLSSLSILHLDKFAKYLLLWQSWVENGNYSLVYFDYITTSKVLYLRTSVKGGAHTCCVEASHIDSVHEPKSSKIQCFECSDVMEICDGCFLPSTVTIVVLH